MKGLNDCWYLDLSHEGDKLWHQVELKGQDKVMKHIRTGMSYTWKDKDKLILFGGETEIVGEKGDKPGLTIYH